LREDLRLPDSNWCGLRLTCELAAKAGAPLSEEEKMMLSFFKGMVSAEDLQEMDTPQLYYSYASFVGFSQGAPEKCQQMYAKCPYSAKKMMQVYRTAHFSGVSGGETGSCSLAMSWDSTQSPWLGQNCFPIGSPSRDGNASGLGVIYIQSVGIMEPECPAGRVMLCPAGTRPL
ncbi:uncharacterized protein LOC122254099, partial [Penaeus japonicus]|uniref:uncharacterized protein LOC122254099 n=1 Tax=Penaeus japonicus TaxID=27405 RepID=UPI001C7152C3